MNGQPVVVSPHTRALEALIRAQAEALSTSGAGGAEQEGMLFLGTWHDAYPTILVRDPFLTDGAKVHFLYLMQEARRKPNGAIAMPSVRETCRVLGHSRGTVIRNLLLLRITRWISLCQRVRDASGRFRGNLYAIHSEPAPLADATYLDDGYIRLLEDSAHGHRNPHVRRAALSALEGIDRDVAEGRDPLEQPDAMARRMEAAATVERRSGGFFGLALGGSAARGDRKGRNDTRGSGEGGAPRRSVHSVASRGGVQNLDPVTEPGTNFDSAPPVNGQNGHRAVQILPGPKFEPGEAQPGTNFRPGIQLTENKESTNFGPGSCSSSGSNKTTTTTAGGRSKSAPPSTPDDLRWPEQFDDNTRRVVGRVLRARLPAEHHQDILDALAHKALDTSDPLRSPGRYAAELCERVRAGVFVPVGPPLASWSPPPNRAPGRTSNPGRDLELSHLRGDIRALERLIEASRTPDARQGLETQLGRLRAQLQEAESRRGARP